MDPEEQPHKKRFILYARERQTPQNNTLLTSDKTNAERPFSKLHQIEIIRNFVHFWLFKLLAISCYALRAFKMRFKPLLSEVI